MNRCIYKEIEDMRFNKMEHVVPAGLGGTIKLPKGYVSDRMNEEFSKIECEVLRESIVGGIRNYIGPGHRGKVKISKKMSPQMNVLKLNDKYAKDVSNEYKYKIGFMQEKKTRFIS